MRLTRQATQYIVLLLKGIAMGAADVVPGVSGGTIAFITGIYTELVDSIKSVNRHSLKILFRGRLAAFWKEINGTFLLVLFSGILISVFSLARLMKYLLLVYPILVWSFFFGLVLISALTVIRKITQWNWINVLSLIIGAVSMYFVTRFSPAESTEAYWFIFLSGAIAICAMVLPGISGAFILLLLGKYQFILQAVSSLDVPVLLVFGAGVVTGLLSFSNLLSWLLSKYHNTTVAILSGFILGSLNKIWPWKEVVTSVVNDHGEIIPVTQRNLLPASFESVTGSDSMWLASLLLCIAGILIVILLGKIRPVKK